MKLTYLKFSTTALLCLFGATLVSAQQLTDLSEINLNDFSSFKDPGKNWILANSVTANPNTEGELNLIAGSGVLANKPGKKNQGTDLFTATRHGDMILELDYLIAKGSNSGIYLQGNYEVQLNDSWGNIKSFSSDNGGIYERWDDTKPDGYKGFGGYAPRQNASKAPGLWQHLKIAFQAPKFDVAGNKITNARILTAELNGVLIHDNVELFGPTRGASSKESALGPLRFQGDHGAVAFKNIKITKLPSDQLNGGKKNDKDADPIYIEASTNTMIRSFVDFAPRQRAVHAISVGSPQQIHYSYDLDNGLLLQGWHGEFVDATPMWDGRGNGTSKARGVITPFSTKLMPAVAQLSNPEAAWPLDSTGTGFRTKGYVIDDKDRPEFKYNIYGSQITDAIKALDSGKGLSRTITIDKPIPGLYVLLANASAIQELVKGFYLIDGQAYYLELDEVADKPIIRDVNGRKEMIILLGSKLKYYISF
jgi:hypothetical protein